MKKQKLEALDLRFISFLRTHYVLIARIAIFVVFFWFGALKLLGLSPAGPLAEALTERTVGLQYFDVLFMILSLIECVIGVLFLFPRAIRVVFPLLLVHMAVVCSPLLLVPELVWTAPFVPTLEGQYIIKNIIIVALAIALAAATKPLKRLT
ncbi:MAG: hypothetical protein ABIR46_00940 [Candidatus Saccharimonadales bacterium]